VNGWCLRNVLEFRFLIEFAMADHKPLDESNLESWDFLSPWYCLQVLMVNEDILNLVQRIVQPEDEI
jgi:hypothetical protein